VESCVARQVRVADHLALVINVKGDVSARLSRLAAEIAEVSRFAFFPEQRKNRHQLVEVNRVERCTIARCAHNLSVVVDLLGDAIWIAPTVGSL
jgi:hypothetical protein